VRVKARRLDVHAGRIAESGSLVLDFAGARLAVQNVIPGYPPRARVRVGTVPADVARWL